MKDNQGQSIERKKFKVKIPPSAKPWMAVIVVAVALFTYVMAVSFDIAFVSGGTEVYRQESVGMFTNFERNASSDEGSSGWNKVYGEKSLSFTAEDGEEKVFFENNYSAVKWLMIKNSLKNLFTFAWSEEDFTIEFTAK